MKLIKAVAGIVLILWAVDIVICTTLGTNANATFTKVGEKVKPASTTKEVNQGSEWAWLRYLVPVVIGGMGVGLLLWKGPKKHEQIAAKDGSVVE